MDESEEEYAEDKHILEMMELERRWGDGEKSAKVSEHQRIRAMYAARMQELEKRRENQKLEKLLEARYETLTKKLGESVQSRQKDEAMSDALIVSRSKAFYSVLNAFENGPYRW